MGNEQQNLTFYVRKNRPGCANELRAKLEDEWLPEVLLVQQRNADLDRQLDRQRKAGKEE